MVPQRSEPFAGLMRDVRLALRRLRRAPLFSAVIVTTLAVGIGANTAIFSLVKGILLDPLPYDEPDRLVTVQASARGQGSEVMPQSAALHFTYEDHATLIERIGLWRRSVVTVLGVDEPRELEAILVTAGTLPTLGVQPAVGRLFRPADDTAGAPGTVVLDHAYWQSQFGGDPGAIGQAITVLGEPREIIGVLPRGFRFLDEQPAVYLPFRYDRSSVTVSNFTLSSVARLKPGVTIEAATADLARLLPVAVAQFPGGLTLEFLEEAQAAPRLRPLHESIVGNVGTVLWVLLGTVGVTLLIACANVATLLLVRTEGRERELAVRTAIGAGGRQLTLQLLVESMLFGVLGGLGGVALAYGGLRLVTAMAPADLPRLDAVAIDGWVLGFTLALALLSGVLFGVFPAIRVGRLDIVGALKEGARGGDGAPSRQRTRHALVVGQIALALVLLVAAGLMIRTVQGIRSARLGFRDPSHVLLVTVTVPARDAEDPGEVARRHERIARRLEELPGVASVGPSTSAPMDGRGGFDPIHVEDFPTRDGRMPPIRRFKWIGGGYFETIGNPIVAGRALSWDDIHARRRVLMVTEDFAREYWDTPAEAVGKRIGTGTAPGNWREIVGVVGAVRDDGVTQGRVPVVYWPMLIEDYWPDMMGREPFIQRSMRYAIRSDRVGTPEFLDAVKQVVWSFQPTQALTTAETLQDIVRRSMARTAFTLVMLSLAAVLALMLATVGVYGAIAHTVSQRTREIGLRIALGADPGTVIGMILRQGLALAVLGVTAGLVAAFWLTELMTGLLVDVAPTDAPTYAIVAAGLTAVAVVATYLPARRAAHVDPIEALKAE